MKSENSQCKHTINGNKTEKERERERGAPSERRRMKSKKTCFSVERDIEIIDTSKLVLT